MSPNSDIFPRTPTTHLAVNGFMKDLKVCFPITLVSAVVGFNEPFIRRALEKKTSMISLGEVLHLINLDAFEETFVPRSKIPSYLLAHAKTAHKNEKKLIIPNAQEVRLGCSKKLIQQLPKNSIQCVVTSTPYWATRIYEDNIDVDWADGEVCPYGHEQTPEAFIRHSVEILFLLKDCLAPTASIWWNIMDTYNTRTQIRGNAAETLKAMQGRDKRGWLDHNMRRYSAGHAYLKDGEQCLIPQRIAAKASRIGYFLKSMVTWAKGQSMPETVDSRVTRELEYILHLSPVRTPYFNKDVFLHLAPELGGRSQQNESLKLTDVWHFSASSGKDGHGAQFPLQLPARCIALTTKEGDTVLDPFSGSGTTLLAALSLNRRAIGFDISDKYVGLTNRRLKTRSQQEEKKKLLGTQTDFFQPPETSGSSTGKKRRAAR
jgi:DNA modification methylase